MRAYMKRYRRRRILRHTPPSARYLEGLGISSCNLRRIQAGSGRCHPGLLRLGIVVGLCPTSGTSFSSACAICVPICSIISINTPYTWPLIWSSSAMRWSIFMARSCPIRSLCCACRSCFCWFFLSLASECACSIAACATAAFFFLSRSFFRASHACSADVGTRTSTSCDCSSGGATCVAICSIIWTKTPYTWHSIRSCPAMRSISIFVARSCPILICSCW